eukprot:3334315-Karenia_brevis.AAC.1
MPLSNPAHRTRSWPHPTKNFDALSNQLVSISFTPLEPWVATPARANAKSTKPGPARKGKGTKAEHHKRLWICPARLKNASHQQKHTE